MLLYGELLQKLKGENLINNLSHVSLGFKDLKKVLKFYNKILGLRIVHEFKNEKNEIYGIFISCGNKTFLEFFKKKKLNLKNKFHFCLSVKNIYLIKKKLLKLDKKVNIKRGKTDKILQFMTQDLEGNLIEFHQYDKKSKKFHNK